jgi:hypothetical protein
MAKEMHSDSISIEQKPDVVIVPPKNKRPDNPKNQINEEGDLEMESTAAADRTGDIVHADSSVIDKDYLAALAFMAEPVTIRLEPSTDKNAATVFPVWVNGQKAQMWINDRWYPVGWLPVGEEITVKRAALEIIARAKIDTIETDVVEQPGQDPDNRIKRFTSAIHSFSVINDSPKGHAWLREVRRRNY